MACNLTNPETVLSKAATITMHTSVACTATIGFTIGIWVLSVGHYGARVNWYKTLVSRDAYMKVLKIQGIALGVCIGCIIIALLMFVLNEYSGANPSNPHVQTDTASDSKTIWSNTEPFVSVTDTWPVDVGGC